MIFCFHKKLLTRNITKRSLDNQSRIYTDLARTYYEFGFPWEHFHLPSLGVTTMLLLHKNDVCQVINLHLGMIKHL